MKYHFYEVDDYRLFQVIPGFAAARLDFIPNLTNFLISLGIKPQSIARPVATALWDRMQERSCKYRSPVRILAILQIYQDMLDQAKMERLDPIQELALWFHDAVYVPHSLDNADFSAAFAVGIMTPWLDSIGKLRKCIERMDTDFHLEDSIDSDAAVLLDLTLAPLASPSPVFGRIMSLIRDDFGGSDDDYRAEQYQYLEQLLKRKKLFRTPAFAELEARLKDNIESAMLDLEYSIV